MPWKLDQLPRETHPNSVGDIFGSPSPPRKQHIHKSTGQLDAIVERSGMSPQAAVLVTKNHESMRGDVVAEDGNALPKNVQKSRINALAKMLGALRR